MAHDVPLRDHLEALIDELEKRLGVQRCGDRKQLMTIIKGLSRALKLQAKEYERRLKVLNNDREEAREKEVDFALMKDFIELKDRVNNNFAARTGNVGGLLLTFIIVSGLSAALSVTLAIAVALRSAA